MKLFVGILAFIVLVFLSAFTVSTLWGWFLVPLGLPVIGMVHAYGLGLVATYITGTTNLAVRASKQDKGYYESIVTGLLIPCFTLLFGYVTHSFM